MGNSYHDNIICCFKRNLDSSTCSSTICWRFVSILKTARSGLAEDEHGYNMWAKGVLLASIASVITYIILTMITTFPLNIVFAVLLGRLLYSTWKYWKTASTLEKAQKIKTLNEDKSEKEKVIIQ